MSWILIATIAYIIMAVSQLVDKALLNVAFKEVKAYVFLIGALSALVVFLLPFGVSLPDAQTMLIAFVGGGLFIVALIPFLSALQGDDATRVIPFIGATIPIVSLIGESIFLGAELTPQDFFAFFLLVSGAVILTFVRTEKTKASWSSISKAFVGAILFASSFVITKYIYTQTGFVNGFFWMRIGGVIVALALLAERDVRIGLKQFFMKHNNMIKLGYFANQGLNATGFVMLNYAISLASVALVNALQGIQYIFVIILVAIASRFKPELLEEKLKWPVLLEKLVAIMIIIAGIALLTL